MHWKNLSNYEYLGAYSIDGIGEITLTIKSIKTELVTSDGGKKEQCIVAYFEEDKVGNVTVKPMVLNKTNCKIIQKIYNTGHVEAWVGKSVTIFATETRLGRDLVPCLRIKPEEPIFKCSVCGNDVAKNVYNGSMLKYKKVVCSKECLDKSNEIKEGEDK